MKLCYFIDTYKKQILMVFQVIYRHFCIFTFTTVDLFQRNFEDRVNVKVKVENLLLLLHFTFTFQRRVKVKCKSKSKSGLILQEL